MKAIVTGAAGFLGRNVASAAAAAGWTVVGLGHSPKEAFDPAAWGLSDWMEGDVDLPTLSAIDGPIDTIFHCAGGASVAYSLTNPCEDFHRTVTCTVSVLEFLRRQGHGRIILPSSAAVYGRALDLPISVTAPLLPISPYGLHKKIAEDMCRSYSQTFGVRAAIIRLFSVYGSGLQKQLLWDACNRLSQGNMRFSGTGEESRDWINVKDAAALMMFATDYASPECPVANGGVGVGVTVRHIVEALASHLLSAESPSFTQEQRAGDPDHHQADISEARAWGWKPVHDLADGLLDYVNWYGKVTPA